MNTLKILYPHNTTVEQKLFLTIDRLSKMKCSYVFTQAVNSKLYPDYHTLVPHKLSFQDLKDKISSGKYQYTYEIYQDLKNIAKNHFVYFKGKQNQQQMLKNVAKFIKALDAVWEHFKEELKICNIDYHKKFVNDKQLERKINEMEEKIKLSLLQKKLQRMGINPIQQKNDIIIQQIEHKETYEEKQDQKKQQNPIQIQPCRPLKINLEIFDEKKQKSLRSKNRSKSQFIPQISKINNNKKQKTISITQPDKKNKYPQNKSLRIESSGKNKYNASHEVENKLKYQQDPIQIRVKKNNQQSKQYKNQQTSQKQRKRSRRKAFKINENIKIYNIDQEQSIEPTMILTTLNKYPSNKNKESYHTHNILYSHNDQMQQDTNCNKYTAKSNKYNQDSVQQIQIQTDHIYFETDQQSKQHINRNYYNKDKDENKDENQSQSKQQQDSNTNTISLNIIKKQENYIKIEQQQRPIQVKSNDEQSFNQPAMVIQHQQQYISKNINDVEPARILRYQQLEEGVQDEYMEQKQKEQNSQIQHINNKEVKKKRGRKKKTKIKINKVKLENNVKIEAKQNEQVSKQLNQQKCPQNNNEALKENYQNENEKQDDSVVQIQKQTIKQQQYHNKTQIQLNPQQIQQQLQNLIKHKLKKYQIILKNLLQWLHLNIIQNILSQPILKCQIHNTLNNDNQQEDEQSKKQCYDCIQYEKQLKLYKSIIKMKVPKYLSQSILQQIQCVIIGQIKLKVILKLLKQFNFWIKLISGSYLEWRIKQQYVRVQGNIIRCLEKIIEYKKLGPDFKQIINKRKQQNRNQYLCKPQPTIKTRSTRNRTKYLNTSFNDPQQYYQMIENCKKNRQKQIIKQKIGEKYNIVDSLNKRNQQNNSSRGRQKNNEVTEQYQQFIKMLEDDQLYNDFKVVIVRDFNEPTKLKIMNKNQQKQKKRRRLFGRKGRYRNQSFKNMCQQQQQDPYDKQTDLDYNVPGKRTKKEQHEKRVRKSRLALLQEQKQQKQRRQEQELQKDDQFLYKYSLRSNALIIQKYQEKLQINWDSIFEKKIGSLPAYIIFDDDNTDVTRNCQGEGIQKYI